MTCSHCGASLETGATFCPSCGEMVLAAPPPAPTPPPAGQAPPRPEPQVVPVPQRPTRQQAPRRQRPAPQPQTAPRPQAQRQRPRRQAPYPGPAQPGPWPGGGGSGRPGRGRPAGYPAPPRRRGPGCLGMLFRLVLLALALPVLLGLASLVLGLGLFGGGDEQATQPSATPTWVAESESALPAATNEPTPAVTPTTSAGAVVPSPGATTTPGTTASSSAAPTPGSATGTATAAGAFPPARIQGRECSRAGSGPYAATAAGNDTTTCAFAQAVQKSYVEAGGDGTPITISAFSQARGTEVRLLCTGDQPAQCTSSTGALVYLYGGTAATS